MIPGCSLPSCLPSVAAAPRPLNHPPCHASFCPNTPGSFQFLNFLLVPDRAPGPVQMRRDRQDIAGRAVKAGSCRVFDRKVHFSSNFRPPSATYPFFWPSIHEYLFMNTSTRFVVCFSFCTRSSNLFSVSHHSKIMNSSKRIRKN